jgi:16S rRNA (guanine527-N7)-methyltransferase
MSDHPVNQRAEESQALSAGGDADQLPGDQPALQGITSQALSDVLQRYGMAFSADQVAALYAYMKLLWDWNERINLTRHTTLEKFVTRDVLDAQQLATLLTAGERVLDWGSGGGVPGIIVQILRPDVRVDLCECVGKKARVLEEMVRQLNLPSRVYARRIEDVFSEVPQPYNTVIARGVGPLWKMLRTLKPYRGQFGQLLTIKGPQWRTERGEARHRGFMHGWNLRRAAEYQNPEEEWESVILRLWPKEDDPKETTPQSQRTKKRRHR